MPGRHEEEVQATPDTIVLYIYHKIDERRGERRTYLTFPPREKPYSIEDLSIAAANHIGIGSIFFLLFGICDPDIKLWYRPNHVIDVTQAEKKRRPSFVFRIRYYPPIAHLSNFFNSEKAIIAPFVHYYFQQMFSDFISGHVDPHMVSCDLSKQWGLGALGMYCFCKQRQLSQEDFIDSEYGKRIKMFLPFNSVEKIPGPFPQKRLGKSLFKVLKQLYNENKDKEELENLLQYVHVMWTLIPNYGSEEFLCSSIVEDESPESIVVDLLHDTMPGVRLVYSRKPSEHFCTIADLKTLSYIPTASKDNHLVMLNRKSGPSKAVHFSSELVVYSFITMLDGAYRLTSDWIYHLASEVESPLLMRLRKLNCFGPVKQAWALKALESHCREQEQWGGSFLLCQERANLTEYRLFVEGQKKSDEFYRIVMVDNRYQVACHDEPIFTSLEELIQHYSQSNNPKISTVTKVILRGPFDPSIYLLQDEKTAAERNVKKTEPERMKVIDKIDIVVSLLGEGQMTNVVMGKVSFHGEATGLITFAVKQLKTDDALNILCAKDFLDCIHLASFWNHSALIGIRFICHSPLSLVMDMSQLGSLEQYLLSPRIPLQLQDLLMAAEQVVEALRYMQEECPGYKFHGNIRCRNILVFQHHWDYVFEVKLSDPGMIYSYCKLPLDHPLNLERLPWIAPECYSNLSRMTRYSDCYAYGMALWEMFSGGDVPYHGVESKKIIDNASKDVPLPQPLSCPDKMYAIMCQCWNVIPDERTAPKEMLRVICDMKSQGIADQYMTKQKLDPNGRVNIPSEKATAMADSPPGAYGDVNTHVQMLNHSPHSNGKPSHPCCNTADISHSMLQVLPRGMAAVNRLPGAGGSAGPGDMFGMGLRPLPRTPLMQEISNFIPPEELQKHTSRKLGEGHYAKVHLGLYKGTKVAIKTLKKEKYDKCRDDFDKELAIMVKLNHPNILNVLGYSRSKLEPMSLVLEYLENGSLQSYLKKNKRQILSSNSPTMRFAMEICEGMLYLAEREIPLVHCDLAARNVLVSGDLKCKISDFGMSRMLLEKDYYRAKPSREMPLRWCSPEVLEYKKYTEKSDVWSYGVTLWEVFTAGDSPHLLKSQEEKDAANQVRAILHCLIKEARRLPCPPACPDSVYRLMLKCWVIEPERRASFRDIKRDLDELPLQRQDIVKVFLLQQQHFLEH